MQRQFLNLTTLTKANFRKVILGNYFELITVAFRNVSGIILNTNYPNKNQFTAPIKPYICVEKSRLTTPKNAELSRQHRPTKPS
jgi:hypothetical protein|tara:strand:+ start:655 stop:906 length:252 start_codon:yes stop_codon:yes gene_type:complete